MLRRRVSTIKARSDVDGAQQILETYWHRTIECGRTSDRPHGAVAPFMGYPNRGPPEQTHCNGQACRRDLGEE